MQRKTLDRWLSRLGLCSRTQAAALIAAGRIRVAGRVVRDPGRWLDPAREEVSLDGRPLAPREPLYLALHKPKGFVTTLVDPEGRPTVFDLLEGVPAFVFPVGRLDRDSSGLLLFTNDSAFGDHLTSPASHVPKTYRVRTRAPLSEAELEPLRRGVELADGPTRPARATLLRAYAGYSLVELELTEGKNRQVRRMLRAIGNGVRDLRRTAIGPLELGKLKSGAWRRLTQREVRELYAAGPT
jgi:pseudouridine synthase